MKLFDTDLWNLKNNANIRNLKQIATEGSATVAGSKISRKKAMRMSDMYALKRNFADD